MRIFLGEAGSEAPATSATDGLIGPARIRYRRRFAGVGCRGGGRSLCWRSGPRRQDTSSGVLGRRRQRLWRRWLWPSPGTGAAACAPNLFEDRHCRAEREFDRQRIFGLADNGEVHRDVVQTGRSQYRAGLRRVVLEVQCPWDRIGGSGVAAAWSGAAAGCGRGVQWDPVRLRVIPHADKIHIG